MAQSETHTSPARAEEASGPPFDAVLGVYVHIPFCQYRCTYCDFATYAGEDEHMAKYVTCLVQEIAMRAPNAGARRVTSIFFGGGTPSRLHIDDVGRILQSIGARFSVATNAEVTLEANPGTLDQKSCASCAGRESIA